MSDQVAAFAPASIGNVAVGFDMLGLAIEGAGDRVVARRTSDSGVSIAEVRGLDGEIHPYLSTDADHNTASIAAGSFWNDHGDSGGVELEVHKGVPLQSGMGSSAASAVAAVFAVNALVGRPLATESLLPYALHGEQYASKGLHADNVAPSLLGGLVLCPTSLLPDVVHLATPAGVSAVLLHPELQVNTAHARRGLAKAYPIATWLEQQGYLATFIAACAAGDTGLLGRSLKDVVIEPQRREAVPCFDAVKDAALNTGAYGCSLSGSGPSIFALCASGSAANIASAMEQACRGLGIDCQSWVSSMEAPGARLESRL